MHFTEYKEKKVFFFIPTYFAPFSGRFIENNLDNVRMHASYCTGCLKKKEFILRLKEHDGKIEKHNVFLQAIAFDIGKRETLYKDL